MATQEEFTRNLPDFTGDPLPIKPPMWFNNLTAKFFPLRASLDALQQLCDGYLNLIPPEVGRFRVSMPYVLLGILDYGQIAESAKQIGWFAQVEVYFSVSVEWYKLVEGQWVFHDYAVITPYIFVDDSFSAPLGRTVYGFPKILSHVAQVDTPWIQDSHTPMPLARIETMVFEEAYAGRRLQRLPLLEITRRSPMSNFELPLSADSPIAPWNIFQNMAEAVSGFGRDAVWLAQTLRITPLKDPAGDPMSLVQQMMAKFIPSLAPGGVGFVQNSLNLKQFRMSNDPSRISYQSLTQGMMMTTGFHGAGLLGEDRTILGDLSGGHRVLLSNHSSLPIARVLGLEVHRTIGTGDHAVAELKPVLPYWMKLDLKYEGGTNLAWRSSDGVWKDSGGNPIDPSARPAPPNQGPYFNDTAVSAIEAIAGPFQFSGTTIRVLPLLALKDKVQEFLERYLNGPLRSGTIRPDFCAGRVEQVRFQVWARPPMPVRFANHIGPDVRIGGEFAYVYVTAASYNGVTSQSNNVGDWAKYELSIQIPVKWERLNGADNTWETVGVGMVPFLTLVDQPIAAISRMEVQGINALTAQFVSPEDIWLGDGKSDVFGGQRQTLLRVDTEVVVAAAQKSKMSPLIEISRRDEDAGLGRSEAAPWAWSETLRQELGCKNGLKAFQPRELQIGRALALELLGSSTPFAVYTLKQFRDVGDPDKACEQALIRIPRVLDPYGLDIREIEETLVVRFYDYPSQEIVKTLGLLATPLEVSSTGIVYSAQAFRPFYIRGTVTEPLSDRLMTRAGAKEWQLHEGAFDTRLHNYVPNEAASSALARGEYAGAVNPGVSAFKPLAPTPTRPDLAVLNEYLRESAPFLHSNLRAERQQDLMDPSLAANSMREAQERRRFIERGISTPKLMDDPATEKPRERKDFFSGNGKQNDISKAQAREALGVVDPQTVIEAVLSREWCNRDENARWRQGRRTVMNLTSTLPEGGRHKGDAERDVYERVNNELALRPRSVAFRLPSRKSRSGGQAPEVPFGSMQDRHGWLSVMDAILDQNELFTELQVEMESNLNEFSSASIGLGEYEASEDLKEKISYLDRATKNLLKHLDDLADHHILGLPSDLSHLDPEVRANRGRLVDLLQELDSMPKWAERNFWNAGELSLYVRRIQDVVSLGRKHCQAQRTALVNKLARAYQKPDYCVRRDSVGSERDMLLPLSFSWDAYWYCGNPVTPGDPPKLAPQEKKEPVARPGTTLNPGEAGPPIQTAPVKNGAPE